MFDMMTSRNVAIVAARIHTTWWPHSIRVPFCSLAFFESPCFFSKKLLRMWGLRLITVKACNLFWFSSSKYFVYVESFRSGTYESVVELFWIVCIHLRQKLPKIFLLQVYNQYFSSEIERNISIKLRPVIERKLVQT